MKVGFIGLGSMGSEMARYLIKAGHELTVYNRTRSHAEPFAALRARIAATPSEAARDVDAVITMLADDPAAEAVVFGSDGMMDSLKEGCAHISMSTISVAFSRRWIDGRAGDLSAIVDVASHHQLKCGPRNDQGVQVDHLAVFPQESPAAKGRARAD